MIKYRNEIGKLAKHYGYKYGAEIGVQHGDFSRIILSSWDGHLTMIDAWQQLPNYRDISNVSDNDQKIAYQNTITKTQQFSNRLNIVKGISPEISNQFADQYFDFVYLDANHSYEAVMLDIDAWIKKVKVGSGCLCGHDYLDGNLPQGDFGVKSAVNDFFKRSPDIITDEPWPSWFIFI